MPKAGKSKLYAVRVGREGPKIYNTWDECKNSVSRWPGAVHKSFTSLREAQEWLETGLAVTVNTKPVGNESSSAVARSKSVSATNVPSSHSQSQNIDGSLLPPLAPATAPPHDTVDFPIETKPKVILSPEQILVLQRVKEGRSVFFTGSAGTGKSVLLREIIDTLGGSASGSLGITASTGIASVNIGGTTLHSWGGIGLGQEEAHRIAGKLVGQKTLKPVLDRWRQAKTLIIDEISMIDGALFDKLEEIARLLRQNDRPFGGIQLVLSGDFCQLPPVPNQRDGVQVSPTFAFDAKTWDTCVGKPVILTRVFRQKDQAFVDMLNAMRLGQLDPRIITEFRKLSRPLSFDDGIVPTELYATRAEVENANNSRLRQLPNPFTVYESFDVPGHNSNDKPISMEQMDRLLERLVATKKLSLKVGAQVMLIKNLIQGRLVNGSVGIVTRFITSLEARRDGTEEAKVNEKEPPKKSAQRWPVVRFPNHGEMLVAPAEFTVNNASGRMEARRDQIPLILAWALSVHKSQGQTLERVKVDLRRTFEKGQAYVALSRATSMQGLQVLNFDPAKVVVHPRVLQWHNKIADQTEVDENSDEYYDDDEMDNEDAIAAYHDNNVDGW